MPLPIGQILAALTTVIPVFKKKKKFCLWYLGLNGRWVKKTPNGISKRQCRKTRSELMRLGADPDRFSIIREGVNPFDGAKSP